MDIYSLGIPSSDEVPSNYHSGDLREETLEDDEDSTPTRK